MTLPPSAALVYAWKVIPLIGSVKAVLDCERTEDKRGKIPSASRPSNFMLKWEAVYAAVSATLDFINAGRIKTGKI